MEINSMIKLNNLSSGGGLPELAPDLTYFAEGTNIASVTVDASAALTVGLSLTGKYAISFLQISNIAATLDTKEIKLTIDGVVIWDSTDFNSFTELTIFGSESSSSSVAESIQCKESFLFEYRTPGDTLTTLNYLVRPLI